MNRVVFSFSSLSDASLYQSLGTIFHTSAHEQGITIPPGNGTGVLMGQEIDNGLLLHYWDIRLNAPLVINKESLASTEGDRLYNILYILQAEEVYVYGDKFPKKFRLKPTRNIIFMNEEASMGFEVPANEPVKAISISISETWLRNMLGSSDSSLNDFLRRMNESELPDLLWESTTPSELKMLAELDQHLQSRSPNPLFTKAKVFSLAAEFFGRLSATGSQHAEQAPRKVLYFDKMMEVETYLKSHLENKLEDLETIARQMNMSLSTLKRHFKLMFGKSIYDYYLQLKMEYAKRVLMDRGLMVNEVASMLGYEKVSCFIDMFKKHHGYSPGSLKAQSTG